MNAHEKLFADFVLQLSGECREYDVCSRGGYFSCALCEARWLLEDTGHKQLYLDRERKQEEEYQHEKQRRCQHSFRVVTNANEKQCGLCSLVIPYNHIPVIEKTPSSDTEDKTNDGFRSERGERADGSERADQDDNPDIGCSVTSSRS